MKLTSLHRKRLMKIWTQCSRRLSSMTFGPFLWWKVSNNRGYGHDLIQVWFRFTRAPVYLLLQTSQLSSPKSTNGDTNYRGNVRRRPRKGHHFPLLVTTSWFVGERHDTPSN